MKIKKGCGPSCLMLCAFFNNHKSTFCELVRGAVRCRSGSVALHWSPPAVHSLTLSRPSLLRRQITRHTPVTAECKRCPLFFPWDATYSSAFREALRECQKCKGRKSRVARRLGEIVSARCGAGCVHECAFCDSCLSAFVLVKTLALVFFTARAGAGLINMGNGRARLLKCEISAVLPCYNS